jgi:F-type H+-transporting ATPase subunit gamma
LIIISTDKGLCGSLNTNILKGVLEWKRQHPNAVFIAVGKKAVMLCRLFGLKLLAQFTQLPEKVSTADILPITELIKQQYLDQSLQLVEVVYTDFINTLSQRVSFAQLLPIYKEDVSDQPNKPLPIINPNYVFEPNPKSLLNTLLPYFLENKLYQVMLEARASEHSARMVAMKNASENAGELVGELQLMFNKSRQASITNELLDITTSMLTLS